MKHSRMIRLMRFWPPMLGAGIKVSHVNEEATEVDVEMKLAFWNKNFVGTQYGGSLYSMTDSFYMLMLIENLGKDYIVWDKAASIQFKKPGKGTVYAKFRLTPARIQEIKTAADNLEKVEPSFSVEVKDKAGDVIATVEKLLYVKRKDRMKNKTKAKDV